MVAEAAVMTPAKTIDRYEVITVPSLGRSLP